MNRVMRRLAFVSLVAVVGVIVFGTAIAVGGNDSQGAPDAKQREATARHRKNWETEAQAHYSKTPGQKRAGSIPVDATKIVKTEMVPLGDDYWDDVPPPPAGPNAAERRTFMAKNKNMRIYYDNGSVEVIGPFEKPPRRAEVVDLVVDGELDRSRFPIHPERRARPGSASLHAARAPTVRCGRRASRSACR
jgi:hypothetical protein